MAFRNNMRNFGKRHGKVGTKFVRGINNISRRKPSKL